MEINKQLYDIASLFDLTKDLTITAETFKKFAVVELAYGNLPTDDIQQVLDDIFNTSLSMTSHTTVRRSLLLVSIWNLIFIRMMFKSMRTTGGFNSTSSAFSKRQSIHYAIDTLSLNQQKRILLSMLYQIPLQRYDVFSTMQINRVKF